MNNKDILSIIIYVFHNCIVNMETRNLTSELIWVYPEYYDKENGKVYTNVTPIDDSPITIDNSSREKTIISFLLYLLDNKLEQREASYKDKYIFDKCCGDIEISQPFFHSDEETDSYIDEICKLHGKKYKDIVFKIRVADVDKILNEFKVEMKN